jgi:hypothetical protein
LVDDGDRFWNPRDFPSHTRDALLPQNDALEAELLKNVSFPVVI